MKDKDFEIFYTRDGQEVAYFGTYQTHGRTGLTLNDVVEIKGEVETPVTYAPTLIDIEYEVRNKYAEDIDAMRAEDALDAADEAAEARREARFFNQNQQ